MTDRHKKARIKINESLCYRREADPVLFDANKELIDAMEEEHPGKLVFFKWWPDHDEKNIVPYVSGKTTICNFCVDLIVPSDSEQYGKFLSVVKEFRKICRHGNSNVEAINKVISVAIDECNGEILIWS